MKPQKLRLGRGLNALLNQEIPSEDMPVGNPENRNGEAQTQNPLTPYRSIQVDSIHVNPHQPRRTFEESELQELAASLKANGLIQPIIVREIDGSFQLIAGERRLRAAKLAGLSSIPAIVRDADSYEQAQLALVENIHRSDLNPIERANAYRDLMTQLGLTQSELATRVAEQRSSVANYLRLLELQPVVQQMVLARQLSLGHAKILAGVSDPDHQGQLARRCVSDGLSVRALEALIEIPISATKETEAITVSHHLKELETTLTKQLGLRVQMRSTGKKGKGRLVIHYSTLDQFDELMRRMQLDADATP